MLAENIITDVFPGAEILEPFGTDAAQRAENSPMQSDESSGNGFSFFHGPDWEKVLTETYGYTPIHFCANESGQISSLLQLMDVRSPLTGCRGVSLPFTDHCEPFAAGEDSFQKLFHNAVELGRSRRWKFLELRGGRKFFGGAPASLSFYGHNLALTGDENQIFDRLDASVRRAIRKSRKEKVTVKISTNFDAVRIFYSLHCKTRRRHGLPSQPFSFFRNVHKHILSQNLGAVVLAFRKKTPVAAAIHFNSGGEAIYKFGASDESFQHLRANNLVMWEAIRWHLQRGAKKLDLGRTSIWNEGLRRFKLNWSAVERKIEYFKFDLQKNRFVVHRDETSGWHNKIFRALPVFASRIAGAALYRHWA